MNETLYPNQLSMRHPPIHSNEDWINCTEIKVKDSPYSTTECRIPELIPVLGS